MLWHGQFGIQHFGPKAGPENGQLQNAGLSFAGSLSLPEMVTGKLPMTNPGRQLNCIRNKLGFSQD